ncbi:MAG: hypothetical protein KF896_00790 [Ignavibacteriae bacterium]|nr:hypothetical protein [Ignavibacteriota bacterium]
MMSCSDTSTNNQKSSTQDDFQPMNIVAGTMSSPTRTYKKAIRDCETPKRDCFDDVIVTAPKEIYFDELDNRIVNQTTDVFFSASGNYLEIFENFSGPALLDLRNGITTMSKLDFGSGVRTYYIHFLGYPDSTPDYSAFY